MDLSYDAVSNRGERVLPGDRAALLAEHAHRYEFAVKFIGAKDTVLDCASGSGYGTKILAGRAEKVIGVDVSPVAVAYARARYQGSNLEFVERSAESLGFEDHRFDVFCSFETLEHLQSPDALLRQARRLLKSGGLLLCSTPNRVASGLRPGERPHNPFHLREWSLAELNSLLCRYFRNVEYFGQRIRSRNKFRWMYLVSKWKRLRGAADITRLPQASALFEKLESNVHWQPDVLIAVCREPMP